MFLKGKIFLISCIFCFYQSANAQMEIGAKAGINISNLISDSRGVAGYSSLKPGFHIGLFSRFRLAESVSLAPELIYSLQGAKYTFDIHSIRYDLSYLQLPVVVNFNIKEKLTAYAGPYLGYLLHTKVKLETNFPVREEDFVDLFQSLDIGMAGGLDFHFSDHLGLGVRINMGLTDIRDNEAIDFSIFTDRDDFNVHNLVFQIYTSYQL